MKTTTKPGTVYLIHLDQPYRHAKHYTGWTHDLDARLADHAAGHGARLLQVARDAGITWQLARTWSGSRKLERAIKRRKHTPRLCPICAGAAAYKRAAGNASPRASRRDAD
ncbi:MAG: endonuclease [Blastocatellia bacterium]